MQFHTLRISKDVCGSYKDFSDAVCAIVAQKMQEYCDVLGIGDLSKIEFSVSPSDKNGVDNDATHNLFVLKVGLKSDNPPLPGNPPTPISNDTLN